MSNIYIYNPLEKYYKELLNEYEESELISQWKAHIGTKEKNYTFHFVLKPKRPGRFVWEPFEEWEYIYSSLILIHKSSYVVNEIIGALKEIQPKRLIKNKTVRRMLKHNLIAFDCYGDIYSVPKRSEPLIPCSKIREGVGKKGSNKPARISERQKVYQEWLSYAEEDRAIRAAKGNESFRRLILRLQYIERRLIAREEQKKKKKYSRSSEKKNFREALD